MSGADVSRQGVQRDLLPLVEGTTVSTKYGMVKTDHILFIASGAFHLSKPSDLIPELQGRFPIRVELAPLSVDDFEAILTSTHASLLKQYQALLGTEGVTLQFEPAAIRRLAQIAYDVNERTENIGARRLSTVMERLLDEVSFDAPNRSGQTVNIDEAASTAWSTPGCARRSVAQHPEDPGLALRIRGVAPRGLSVAAACADRTPRAVGELCEGVRGRQAALSSFLTPTASRPSKINVSTVSSGRSVIGASLTAAPPPISSSGSHAAARLQAPVLAPHGAGNRVGAAAHQRVAGVGGELHHLAGGHLQAGRAHLERLEHQAEARQDQATQEAAVGVERIHRDRGADHHHQRRPRGAARQHAPARADQRHPAVGTQARRMVIAIDDARLLHARHHPARRQIPQFELLLDPHAHRLAGHDAAEHALRRREALPVAFGQVVDGLQEYGALARAALPGWAAA